MHVPGHEPLFSIRPRETQGFSLDFRQHVSAAGLSWRLRGARRDTWTRAAGCSPSTRRKVSRLVHLSISLLLRLFNPHHALKKANWVPPCGVTRAGARLLPVNLFDLIIIITKKKKKDQNYVCRDAGQEHSPALLFGQLRAELRARSFSARGDSTAPRPDIKTVVSFPFALPEFTGSNGAVRISLSVCGRRVRTDGAALSCA